MKKNIEWLKREIHKELESWQGVEGGIDEDGINEIMLLIDQLDEPEVLSQEWIDEHTYHEDEYDFYYADPDELKNLLVPKQELPVIPEFVAEYLEFAKSDTTLMRVLELANTRNEWEKWEKEYDWIEENHELFARAWLDGFTIAVEEKKYYILLPKIKRNWRYVSLRGNYDEFIDHYTDSIEDLQAFTEKEIKAVEPRYFAFAVPVEELGE